MTKSSARRIASSRANGALSRGPITAEGKARSSQNAITHGLTANTVVLSTESKTQFQTLADRYLNFFQPSDPVQEDMVEDLAVCKWRLRRILNFQHAMIDRQMDLDHAELQKQCPRIDPPLRSSEAVKSLHQKSNILPHLSRYESRERRAYNNALKVLGYKPNLKSKIEPNPTNGHPPVQ